MKRFKKILVGVDLSGGDRFCFRRDFTADRGSCSSGDVARKVEFRLD